MIKFSMDLKLGSAIRSGSAMSYFFLLNLSLNCLNSYLHVMVLYEYILRVIKKELSHLYLCLE